MSKVRRLENPATAHWGRALLRSDYNKMLIGFTPEDMDDKWKIVTDAPDARGDTVVHICRSWTSHEHIALAVTAGNSSNAEAKGWAMITGIAWREEVGSERVTEDDAKKRAIGFCKRLLNCEMED